MKKPTDLSKFDVASRQRDVLDYVLKNEAKAASEPVVRESIAEARAGTTQLDIVSNRDTIRLLFISRDTELLNQTTQSLDGYLELCDVFDEVHIVILQPGIRTRNPVLRVAPNVWLYVASAKHWWWTPYVALELINSHLVFAGGFRSDLIVARDPYESALVAAIAGRRYTRATQLHVLSDFTKKLSSKKVEYSFARRLLARYVVPKFQSIRTNTDQLTRVLQLQYPTIPDIATLPRFHNYFRQPGEPVLPSIKDTYRQFSFIILYVGALDTGSLAYQVIDATRNLLRNPRIGLVIVGEGSARAEFMKRAEVLGMKTQVVFEKNVDAIRRYFETADVLVVPDQSSESDEVTMQGAATGIPMIMAPTPLRNDLFVDGESVFFYEENNTTDMTAKINRLLNDNGLRRYFSDAVKLVAESRLHEDPVVYQQAYRDSVEAALLLGAGDETESEDS
jgi:glycosyltransferase involved in cell wall biosynthesis